jgi:uncharacterized protein YjcR
MLGEKVATVHSWKKRDKWGDYGPLEQMKKELSAEDWKMMFMCEWPQADKEPEA